MPTALTANIPVSVSERPCLNVENRERLKKTYDFDRLNVFHTHNIHSMCTPTCTHTSHTHIHTHAKHYLHKHFGKEYKYIVGKSQIKSS